MSKKICIFTGTRAEYGLLYNLIKKIDNNSTFKLQIIASGMHLSPEFGFTYKEIESDGFVNLSKAEIATINGLDTYAIPTLEKRLEYPRPKPSLANNQ